MWACCRQGTLRSLLPTLRSHSLTGPWLWLPLLPFLQARAGRPPPKALPLRSPVSESLMQEVSAITPLRLSDHLVTTSPVKPVLIDHGPACSTQSKKASSSAVRSLLKQKIQNEGIESAFFIADLGSIVRQHNKWQRLLPRIVSCSCQGTYLVLSRRSWGACRARRALWQRIWILKI